MEYAKHNGSLSGIQRVVSSVLTHAQAWARGQGEYDVTPIVPEYDRFRVLAVDFDRLVALIKMIEENQDDGRGKINAAINAVYGSRVEVYPGKGDVFVIAGAFWIYPHYDLLLRLRARGVLFGLFVHDLIQIKNPEYVHKEATLVFRRSFTDALGVADFLLTNSHFVAGEVKEFLEGELNLALPVAAIPLATELRVKPGRDPETLSPQIRKILSRDYVLCVGTVEVRKNHLLLVKIWERLAQEMGDQLPDLVFVGKWGWDIAPLQKHLDTTNFLNGRIRVVTNASDVVLTELYRHCLLTAYTSFAEGFGLPVGESLAYGKPCVASRATSLPEVGGRFARYIDPNDPDEGVAVFRDLLSRRDEIARWSADIVAHYRPKTWREFTDEFLEACVRSAQAANRPRRPNNCRAPAGATYELGDDAFSRLESGGGRLSTLRMARDAAWHPIEEWGCWSAEREAALWFRTDLPAGTRVVIGLKMHAPPDSQDADVGVRVNEGPAQRFTLYRSAAWRVVSGVVGEDGALHIQFDCRGAFGRPDARRLYLGLDALALYDAASAARIGLSRRAVRTRIVAAARQSVARWRKTARTFVPVPSLDAVRQIARQEAEAAREGGLRLRILGPQGEIDAPLALAIVAPGALTAPAGAYMTAANCLARDFYSQEFAAYCESVGQTPQLHKGMWEYAFVAHHLNGLGALRAGAAGLAISAPEDPLPAALAAVVGKIDHVGATSEAPADRRYDFLWSVSVTLRGLRPQALQDAVDLVEGRLNEGGVAVFTDDFNVSAYARDAQQDGAFVRADIEALTEILRQRGHSVAPLPFEHSLATLDSFVDLPPFASGVHLKTLRDGAVISSFGLVVRRGIA